MLNADVLHVCNATILVITVALPSSPEADEQFRRSIQDRLRKYGVPRDVPVWVVQPGISFATLTDADLGHLGLMRKP